MRVQRRAYAVDVKLGGLQGRRLSKNHSFRWCRAKKLPCTSEKEFDNPLREEDRYDD